MQNGRNLRSCDDSLDDSDFRAGLGPWCRALLPESNLVAWIRDHHNPQS